MCLDLQIALSPIFIDLIWHEHTESTQALLDILHHVTYILDMLQDVVDHRVPELTSGPLFWDTKIPIRLSAIFLFRVIQTKYDLSRIPDSVFSDLTQSLFSIFLGFTVKCFICRKSRQVVGFLLSFTTCDNKLTISSFLRTLLHAWQNTKRKNANLSKQKEERAAAVLCNWDRLLNYYSTSLVKVT